MMEDAWSIVFDSVGLDDADKTPISLLDTLELDWGFINSLATKDICFSNSVFTFKNAFPVNEWVTSEAKNILSDFG